VFAAPGIEIVKIPPRALTPSAYAERWVQTVRSECLDWTLIVSRRHLKRVLTEYVEHSNTARPHRGVNLQPPAPPAHPSTRIMPPCRIERTDVLGGLIHEYRHAA
jgi:transposase InsO family protein